MLDKWDGQYISKFAFLRKYEDPKPLVVAGSSSSSSSSSSGGGGSRAAATTTTTTALARAKKAAKTSPRNESGGGNKIFITSGDAPHDAPAVPLHIYIADSASSFLKNFDAFYD